MRPKVKAFVDEFSSNKESFTRASRTWRTFREMKPVIKDLSHTLKTYDIPFLIIMGSYDQVIRPKQAYRFAKRIDQVGCVREIPNGHHFFKTSSINKFLPLLPFLQH
jgi:pimeloyl-ACP methyl ester carboxylesterase